jgi:hypothetical protein
MGVVSSLAGCFGSEQVALSKEQVFEVMQLQVKNIGCYYYGEYSSDLEAPIMGSEHREYADKFTTLLINWYEQHDKDTSKITSIDAELKSAFLRDIETAKRKGLPLAQSKEFKKSIGDCREVRFASKRLFARLGME